MDSFANIMSKKENKKAPAYAWQDLALTIIKELNVPSNKRSSVFKACKENPKEVIIRALNDTKELCKEPSAWRYFFKIINNK